MNQNEDAVGDEQALLIEVLLRRLQERDVEVVRVVARAVRAERALAKLIPQPAEQPPADQPPQEPPPAS